MQKDRYEILGPLGFGATSRVDKARDKIIGRTVAIKTLVHSFGAAPQQKQFLREAQIVGQLSHPAIVNLFDVGVEETGIAYLVMEYVNGRTLQQVLSESPIPWPRACSWAADLATALGRAHSAGIIHGDVKPANIMITEDGEVKLSDFGIARFATQVSGSGRIMGTPAYLAPEQIMGEPHSTRSDLFSLGIVLYQMLTGVPPFDGSSVAAVCAQILTADPIEPSRRNPALPSGLDHIVMRCLAKKPEDRYPSGDALAASLYPLARRTPVPPPRSSLSWWSRPIEPRDIWAFASVILLAGGSVPAGRAVVSHFHMPPAPALIASFTAPKVPEDLRGYPVAEVALPVSAELGVSKSLAAPRRIRTAPRSDSQGHRRIEVARAVAPATRDMHSDVTVPALALPAAAAAPVPVAVQRAALRIKIDATVADGTLAIFADHDLLLTTGLREYAAADPMRLERILPAGPHQLRVALYRADKSLQTEKEGLGELRADTANTLTIRVSKRAKMLVRRETTLEVIWPSAISPQRQAATAAPSITTATALK
ncbi:MAG TPA: serine/threonine-protein kinase [Candidatus Acidoferrum sp.]|nr:serine/threonine-protein kinase [Candidatus Acidoferrum sp.]